MASGWIGRSIWNGGLARTNQNRYPNATVSFLCINTDKKKHFEGSAPQTNNQTQQSLCAVMRSYTF